MSATLSPPTVDDVHAAAELIGDGITRTPCLHSATLSELIGADVWVKFENLQFTGAFKDRGALNRLLALDAGERERGVIALSAGNHAQGVAHHARRLGVPATIVMPSTTPYAKVRRTKVLGAEVIQAGADLSECVATTEALIAERGLTLVHPFDDRLVIAGQGTCGLEIAEQVPGLDDVVVPVGGGGLISGIALALAEHSPDTRITGVQTETYAAVAGRFSDAPAGSRPRLRDRTLADGVAVKSPGGLTLPIIERLVDDVVTVPEDAIETAISLYLDIEKTVAEGAGALSLAALLAHTDRFVGRRVCCVLTGGNIDTRLLGSVITRQLVKDGRLSRLRIAAADSPGSLAEITAIISEAGANVVDVDHQRTVPSLSARSVRIDITVETRDRQHTDAVVSALTSADLVVDIEST